MPGAPRIAVVGMGCVFPGARDLDAYAANLEAGRDAIREVPPARWDPLYYDPESAAIDRLYCRRGGFIDEFASFDPLEWGLMPVAVQGSEPDQMLALDVAARALGDAGSPGDGLDRERVGVVLGRGGYATPGVTRLIQRVRTSEELAASLGALVPGIDRSEVERVKAEYQARVAAPAADTLIGLVPNLAASRIANRLDLHGPAYTVDAACASSLIAVQQACDELAAGRCDLMLAGGVHLTQDVVFWSVFCQLGALSRSERIRPFHREADGLLIGEGVAFVALKRLTDAERDGDRIRAVIAGCGVSSDGRESSVMTPRVRGQELALERAWRQAGLDPKAPGAIGLVEAHGTATPAGDAAELETLARFFGPPRPGEPPAGLGSVKSMIGHAMPAAGMAGLIKAVLAVERGRLLPTLHCEEPHPLVERTRFRPVLAAEAWEANGGPRRAAVNAFGFGGINAHVVVEEHTASAPRGRRSRGGFRSARPPARAPASRPAARPAVGAPAEPALLVAAADVEAIRVALEGLDGDVAGGARVGEGPCRLAILAPDPARIERAREIVRRGAPFRDRRGEIRFAPRGLLSEGGGVAFLYPGFEGDEPADVGEVAARFGLAAPEPIAAGELERRGAAIVQSAHVLTGALRALGVEPDFLAGHSVGEWSAMLAAGALSEAGVAELLANVEPGTLTIPEGAVFAAVGCGADRIAGVGGDLPDVHVALDNCPRQAIVCGPAAAVEVFLARLRSAGVLCQVLPFRSGFHSPHFAGHLGSIRPIVDALPLSPPRAAIWSATTCAPLPSEPEAIRELFARHLVEPVRFRELVERLHAAGARAFVQVGSGSLTGFVGDTLSDRPHVALAAADPRRPGLTQLARLATALWVEGAELNPARFQELVPRYGGPERSRIPLALSAPLVSVRTPLAGIGPPVARLAAGAAELASAGDPVLEAFAATLEAVERGSREVLEAWRERARGGGNGARRAPPEPASGPAPPAGPREARTRRLLSLDACPALVDHSFFNLPPDWPRPEDGFPVVPFTMSLSIMMQAAEDLVPGRVAVGLEGVRAYRWLALEEPVELAIDCRFDGADRVAVRLGDYAEGTVVLGSAYPPAPAAAAAPFPEETEVDTTPAEMYADRVMFHGPRYRSLVAFHGTSREGIRGVVERLAAEGSLLDGAGQLLGFWIRADADRDRIAMPVMLERATFYGPEPEVGARLDCTVTIRRRGARQVRADIDLARGGRLWAAIEGWEDRRMESDSWMWTAMQHPERNILSRPLPDVHGCCLWPRPFESASVRDYFARRYLDAEEMDRYRALPPDRKMEWLGGRIAAKDAVRRWLWERGHGPIFPIEVSIGNEPGGRPVVRCPASLDLRLSIAHKPEAAVARVSEGVDQGIDIERIEPRPPGFDEAAFAPEELRLLPEDGRDEWRARFWAAKEAAAKRRGTGFAAPGGARGFPITAMEGYRFVVDGIRVATTREGDLVVAWTEE